MNYKKHGLNGLKRTTALVLMLAMVLTSMGISGWGMDETYAADSINCYITVSVAGEIAEGKNGNRIVQVPVTVTDQNDNTGLDIDDALFAPHEAYYEGGANAGYVAEDSAYGLGITTLWGDTSGSYGYYVNNNSSFSLRDSINSGDYINAYVYSDSSGYSDSYIRYDTFTKTAEVGENIPLKLEKMGYDAEYNPVWSDLTAATIYDVANPSIALATTDASGDATISFPAVGTYYISATHSSVIVPPVCKIIVTEPNNYATVRIEANGFGTDGMVSNVDTVLNNTMVNLDTLAVGYKAIDVVNAALAGSGLDQAEGTGGFYTAFGGVSAEGSEYWAFMINDESASSGLDDQEAMAGDDLVLMLTGSSPAPDYFMTLGYSYFKTLRSSSDVQWGYAYGEVALVLYSKEQNGTDALWNPIWNITPVANTYIYSNGNQAYTPDSELAVTDKENGVTTITLWGGTVAGTYYFDITATVDGATSAYTRVKMVYDGENAPTLTFSAPSANDTTLSEITLNFPGATATNGISYLGKEGISVGNNTEGVSIFATANAIDSTIEATYKDADDLYAAGYLLGESINLLVGENTFKLVVTNETDTQIHTLIITREAAIDRNIPNEVATLINGLKTVTGDAPYTDWVLAMNAAGLSPTQEQVETYLASVLTVVDNFVDEEIGNPANMAKIAIALTALGIDPREIPDPDGGGAIDLVSEASVAYDVAKDLFPVYSAPYFLSLYDLGNYQIPTNASSSRMELINAILDAEEDWNAWGPDGIGMVLPALAPYYNAINAVNGIDSSTCADVTSAVNRAIESISNAQTIDGGFGTQNSSTISTVITGLNSIDKNPNTDEAFIKGGNSLLMNLLSFRTSDNKLGYTNANSQNTMACYQGFQALATWQNLSNIRSNNLYHFEKEIAPYTNWPNSKLLTGITVTTRPITTTYEYDAEDSDTAPNIEGIVITATYNGDSLNTEIIDVEDCKVSTIDRTEPGTKAVTVEYQNKTTTFFVRVKTAEDGFVDEDTASVTIDSGRSIIARNNSIVIEAGVTSTLDVLKTLLDSVGKTYVIRNGAYVAEVDGVGEFDKGENSGWLYSVNGITPETTASNGYILKDGDRVLWYYTLNYKTDSSSSAWSEEEGTATEFVVKEDGKGSATLGLAKEELAKIVNDGGTIKVKSSIATIEMDAATLKGLGSKMGKNLEIVSKRVDVSKQEGLTQEMIAQIGDRPVVDLTVMIDGKKIANFDGTVTVSIPYVLKAGENPNAIVLYLLRDDGTIEMVKNANFDSETGEVRFTTDHFSLYGIGYKDIGFADINGHWAKDFIAYLAARDYISGMTKEIFAPNETLTRGQFVQLLANLAGADLAKYGDATASSISDVNNADWFAPAVAWAVEQGIVTGIAMADGTTNFYPEKSISRQDIAVMLNRYRDKIDKKAFSEDVKEKSFQDKDQIGDYAKEAVKALQMSGIIQGKSDTTFAPLDQAKRGEAAKMIHGMLKLN